MTFTIRVLIVLLAYNAVYYSNAQVQPLVTENGVLEANNATILGDDGMVRRAQFVLQEFIKKNSYGSSIDKAIVANIQTDVENNNYSLANSKAVEFLASRPNSPFVPAIKFVQGVLAFQQLDYNLATQRFAETSISCIENFSQRNDSSYLELDHSALFWQASSLSLLGKYEEAQPVYDQVKAREHGIYADDALFSLGQIAEQKREFEKAISYYDEILRDYSYSNSCLASRIRSAQCYLQLRQPKQATPLLESALNLYDLLNGSDPKKNDYEKQTVAHDCKEQIHFLRGEALNQLGIYEQALNEFKKVISGSPTRILLFQSHLGSGWASLNLGLFSDALTNYNYVIDSLQEESSRIKATALLYRAVTYKKLQKRDLAIQELNTLSVTPGFPYIGIALLELGQIHYENGKFELARKALERAERESTDPVTSVRVELLLGATHTELQQWQRAIRAYQEAEIKAKKPVIGLAEQREQFVNEARFKRGIAYCQNQQYREAMNDLTTFIGSNENDTRMDEAVFWLTESYYRADLLQNAEETYKRFLVEYPASKRREEVLYGLGWTYFRTKQFDEANSTFTKLIDEYPKSRFILDVQLRKGDALYLTKKYIEAGKLYKEAYKKSPKSDEGQYAQFQIGQCLYRSEDYPNAITQLKTFIKNFPDSKLADNAQYTIAWIRSLQEKQDESISEFEYLIKTYSQSPLIPQAMYYIANAQFNKGDYETAIQQYQKVIDQYPSDYWASASYEGMHEALMALGRTDEAIEIGKKYIEMHPNSQLAIETKKQIAYIFKNKGDFANAAKEYQEFLKQYPESEFAPEALYQLAKSQIGLNDLQGAEESFQLLLKKYPKSDYSPQAMFEYGMFSLSKSDISKADSLLKQVTISYPENEVASRANFERAQIYIGKGDSTTALQLLYANTIKGQGEYAYQSRYKLAMSLREKNLYDSARKIFEPLITYTDNPLLAAEAAFRTGELWMRENRWNEAIQSFTIVKEKYDKEEDWYTLSIINLGECYEKVKDNAKAKEMYQTVIILHGADDYGKTASSRLKRMGK
ncbi:MAG: tetratricopeptide repeat protein [Candidatus Kapaibacterium sp.]